MRNGGRERPLLTLALDRRRAAALGRAGAEGVRRFYGVDQMADAAERVYKECL